MKRDARTDPFAHLQANQKNIVGGLPRQTLPAGPPDPFAELVIAQKAKPKVSLTVLRAASALRSRASQNAAAQDHPQHQSPQVPATVQKCELSSRLSTEPHKEVKDLRHALQESESTRTELRRALEVFS